MENPLPHLMNTICPRLLRTRHVHVLQQVCVNNAKVGVASTLGHYTSNPLSKILDLPLNALLCLLVGSRFWFTIYMACLNRDNVTSMGVSLR